MKYLLSVFLMIVFLVVGIGQEPDQTPIPFDRLGQNDIEIKGKEAENQKVLSASRTLKSADELPFTIYIVTKEEIFNNNYTTLVDVLKTVPGIKVSQPGSALEGETFLMRGLLGNGYAKILVNDLPVKPSVVSGMPIGAQLPIKQAERIEIIFGPAASIYGADASAGVINIITSQTERPIYAQADLSTGSNQYRHLNVMFGGKFGRGKRILKFTAYGSSTEYMNRNTLYDFNLFNPGVYGRPEDIDYLDNPNYSFSSSDIINRAELPHESQTMGVQLKYRSLSFSLSRMFRRDHSAVGLSPRSVSYSNPTTFTGEIISNITFGWQKKFRRWNYNINFNYLGYEMNPQSSTIYIDNTLSRLLNTFVDLNFDDQPQVADSLKTNNFNRFFSGSRYQYSDSRDFFLEQLFTLYPFKFMEIIAGGSANVSASQTYRNYLITPYQGGFIFNESIRIPYRPNDDFNIGAFTQFYFDFDKLNIIAGLRYDYFYNFGESINPRIAAIYKMNSNFSFHFSAASAYRVPSPFYQSSTYEVSLVDYGILTTRPLELLPEETETLDIGIRARLGEKVKGDISFFASQTNSFISPVFNITSDGAGNASAIVGYGNDETSNILLYGVQARFVFDNISETWDLDMEANLNYNQGREILPFSGEELDRVRMQPEFSGQVKISFELIDRFYVHLNSLFSTSWLSRNRADTEIINFRSDDFEIPGFYTLDLMGRLQLTPTFNAFVNIKNIFNTDYGGIGATGTFDDLLYNPQPNSTIELGMSYRMQ